MRVVLTGFLYLSLVLSAQAPSAPETGSDAALKTYKDANYELALPLLKAAIGREPKNAVLRAAYLSALVYQGKVDEAGDVFEAVTEEFPNSIEVLTARAEYVYYMGDMVEAERLFRQASKPVDTARATYGMYRLFYAASLYRTARLLLLHAHDLDPDDALITRAWISYLSPEKRREIAAPFREAHPWLYAHLEEVRATNNELAGEINHRKVWELDGEQKEITLHLLPLMYTANRIRGLGLNFSIEGGHNLRMLFDTGASGVLINQNAVDKIGLSHLGSIKTGGIGDGGTRNGFLSIADQCQVDSLKYKTCVMRVVEGKHVGGDEDGLIGADFFEGYLVHIDFQKHLLHLTPLPPREPSPQGYDRAPLPEEKGFTPIFRHGHSLFVTTKVNDKISGLFLLDTGSSQSMIDETFARLSTKVYGNSWMHVKGISGDVKNVFEADRAELMFARYRQQNLGLTAFNLNNRPEHQDVRLSGIMGFPLLSLFRLTIDYRNGLVNFDYILK